MPRNPTPAQLALIRRAAEGEVYVYRTPDRVGAGITPASLDIAVRERWLVMGEYEALKGRRLHITDKGRGLLPAAEQKENQTDA
jgi:hypothetical protein